MCYVTYCTVDIYQCQLHRLYRFIRLELQWSDLSVHLLLLYYHIVSACVTHVACQVISSLLAIATHCMPPA